MITDEERRRAATVLREASTGAYRHVDSLDVIANAVGVEVAGKFSYEVENETYATLVDFIDRPTCHDVGGAYTFRCSVCGCSIDVFKEDVYGAGDGVMTIGDDFLYIPSFCPWCGSKVVER